MQAIVDLVASGGRRVARVTTDSGGAYRIPIRATGSYELRVRRLGYKEHSVGALSLTPDSSASVDILLRPIVATLSPVLVRATKQLFTLVRPAELGRRLIDPQRVSELVPRARSVEDLVLLQSIPGISIYEEPPNIRCARLVRGKPVTSRTALGEPSSSFPRLSHGMADQIGCMLMFVDNVRVEDLMNVDPNIVELAVVLLPHEAGVLYGTGASRGVLLVYTKRGGR